MFRDVEPNVDRPALERAIIEFWNDKEIFRRSIDRPAPKGEWVFYEGPPTANGKPGVHHVISRSFKDLFPRFKTMQGFRVGRKGGWDTHGLPVEIAVEKRLGFTNKQQIEEYGIARFNELCRQDVFSNIQDWNAMTERIGFWIDLEDAYVTYHNSYIESCWWIMKTLFDRGLLVEDYKTTWHSPSSNTTLASHEVSLGYRENVIDPSIYPKFPAKGDELISRGLLAADETRPVYFMAWTTTPWTLPANVALAVAADADYALVEGPSRHDAAGFSDLYWLAAELVDAVFPAGSSRTLRLVKGRDLTGLTYVPIMHGSVPEGADLTAAWRVVTDDLVTLSDGTGIVHIAPSYGDLEVGRRHGLPPLLSVDLTGKVLAAVRPQAASATGQSGPYAGMWFKDADDAIIEDLTALGLMYRATTISHTYPFNWRDDTPLMSVAKRSWYIRTTAVKDLLLANNDAIGWHPDHIRTGRFGKWLENNVDWALSRERYWGATLPIWRGVESGKQLCVGTVKELEQLTGRDLSQLDLHRPYVDEITFELGGETYRREPYTVDVWFESGAMPYAQWHYLGADSPAAVVDRLMANFPADYICEAIDQTRGWFYSLHALATLLTDPGDAAAGRPPGALAHLFTPTSAFKNLNVLGHIVDEKGEKMSKSKGNVVDPWTVLDAQGADALRWYLYSASPPEATKSFSADLVEETLRDFFMTLWNVYGFFVLYANLETPDLANAPAVSSRPLVDRWLAARLTALTTLVTAALEDFDPTTASRTIRDFVVDELSNWYVRRNRRRFWRGASAKSADAADSLAAYASLYEALVGVAKLMAPLAPFTAEEIYRNLVLSVSPAAEESVHLAAWPQADDALRDESLLRDMRALQKVVELGRAARAASGVKLRQPLSEVLVRVRNADELAGVRALEDQLREELNVKAVRFLDVEDAFVDYQVKPNLPRLGKRLGKLLPALRDALLALDGRQVAANVREGRATVVEVGSQRLELAPEDVLLDARSPEGFAAVEDRGYLAALNTTLTPSLVREGLARDAVRLIQNARKDAGLEVSDRIRLELAASGELLLALQQHRASIAAEVLATEIVVSELGSVAGSTQSTLRGEQNAQDAASAGAVEKVPAAIHQESHVLGGDRFSLELSRSA
ncbi:MAG TPA: isoleucine--tRNA ligase [Trueperaceae bacterium]|nr:isoleucine--tRNA ligase [Trueperaceae bacterium]